MSGKSFTFTQIIQCLSRSKSGSDAMNLSFPLKSGVSVLEVFGSNESRDNPQSTRFGKCLRLTMQVIGYVMISGLVCNYFYYNLARWYRLKC